VSPLDDERAPEGSVLGTFIGARLIARCAMPREAIDQLMSLKLFEQPVPLALLAVEEDPGIQARLFALVPSERIIEAQEEIESEDEPWKSSVPSFENSMDDDDDLDDEDDDDDDDEEGGARSASIHHGYIDRCRGISKTSDGLAAEAGDIPNKIGTGGKRRDVHSRPVDDLLESS